MAAAAAAAAALAPPGCPGSCPNFAVVCSFLERYGPLLDLPELPFPELERVLQAPPRDVGNGEGKRGARTPGGKRPWHASSFCSSHHPWASAALSAPRGAAPPGRSSRPRAPGVSGCEEAGRRPPGATRPSAERVAGESRARCGLGAGGVIVRSGCPRGCYPAAEAGPPPRLPLGGGGRGAQVPASLALFSSSSSPLLRFPSSHPPLDHLGRGWAPLGAPPFFPSTWVGGGRRTLQLSL